MSKEETAPPKFRWKIPVVILLVAGIAAGVSWNLYAGNLTMQVFWLYPIISGTAFALFFWWTFLSRLCWRTRLTGLAAVAAIVGLFLLVMKFNRFDGAMIPKFSSRWVNPLWPAAVYLMGVGGLFISALSWKVRGIGLSAVGGLVALSVGVFGFDGFALKPPPNWNDDGGPRSPESNLIAQQLEEERARLESAANGQRANIRLSDYTPAELLRMKDFASWERWQFDDGLSAACGCTLRAVFRSESPQWGSGDWPQFRGPNRNGVALATGLRFDWSNENPPPNLWKPEQSIGKGWSSFAVVSGRAMTQEQRKGREMVVCYDFRYGTEIWKHVDDAHFESVQGGIGPRATPTVVGRRVYTLGATGVLNCLDILDGSEYWQRNILDDAGAENISWGMAGSPLVAGNLVFVNAGGGGGKAVIAYDRFTGDIVWANGNEQAGYCSPVLRRIHGVPQLLIFHGEGVTAYNPNTGRQLWSYPWTNVSQINVAVPIVKDNRVFISSGYSRGSVLLKVEVDDGDWSVEEVWKQRRFRLKFNDAVYHDGYLYGLDETILTCLRFEDGKIMWRRRRLGPGGGFGYGQVLLAGETLIVTGEETGWVSFIRASPETPRYLGGFRALNREQGLLDEKGNCWNQPVISHGRLLLRNEREVACYALTGESTAQR